MCFPPNRPRAGSETEGFESSFLYELDHLSQPPIMSVLCRKSHQTQDVPDSIEPFVMGSLDRQIKELCYTAESGLQQGAR